MIQFDSEKSHEIATSLMDRHRRPFAPRNDVLTGYL